MLGLEGTAGSRCYWITDFTGITNYAPRDDFFNKLLENYPPALNKKRQAGGPRLPYNTEGYNGAYVMVAPDTTEAFITVTATDVGSTVAGATG
jgi:hypothetical protein